MVRILSAINENDIPEKKDIVYLSNSLVHMLCKFSITEFKFFLFLLKNINPLDSKNKEIIVSKNELYDLLDPKTQSNFQKNLNAHLFPKFTCPCITLDNKKLIVLESTRFYKEGSVRLVLHDDICPHLFNLKKGYTKFSFNFLKQFKNVYAVRLYLLLQSTIRSRKILNFRILFTDLVAAFTNNILFYEQNLDIFLQKILLPAIIELKQFWQEYDITFNTFTAKFFNEKYISFEFVKKGVILGKTKDRPVDDLTNDVINNIHQSLKVNKTRDKKAKAEKEDKPLGFVSTFKKIVAEKKIPLWTGEPTRIMRELERELSFLSNNYFQGKRIIAQDFILYVLENFEVLSTIYTPLFSGGSFDPNDLKRIFTIYSISEIYWLWKSKFNLADATKGLNVVQVDIPVKKLTEDDQKYFDEDYTPEEKTDYNDYYEDDDEFKIVPYVTEDNRITFNKPKRPKISKFNKEDI